MPTLSLNANKAPGSHTSDSLLATATLLSQNNYKSHPSSRRAAEERQPQNFYDFVTRPTTLIGGPWPF